MEKFVTWRGIAAPLDMANVDTDAIIPKQFLKTITRQGLGEGLFYDFRYDESGVLIKDFVLNRAPYDQAKILIAGDNFGCGSSREHAPWSLLDFGVRCVISPGFADIFHNNCFKNGILPVTLPAAQVDVLMEYARGDHPVLQIDLPSQRIIGKDVGEIGFSIDPFLKQCLLEGIDDIGLTLKKSAKISAFEKKQRALLPWLYA